MTTENTITDEESGATEANEQTTTDTEHAIPQETIDYARAQGWVPREEFRGPADKWVDADEFAARATQINGILKQTNTQLRAELEAARTDAAQARKDATEAVEFVRKAERQRYEAQLADLRAEKAAAIRDGDGERVVEIESRMEALPKPSEPAKAPAKTEAPAAPAIPDAVREAANAFAERNPWFDDTNAQFDPVKADLVLAVSRDMRRRNPNIVQSPSYFTELEKAMVTRYPTIFGKKTPAPLTESGGKPGGGSKTTVKKGYADLPPEAKAVADRYEANEWLSKEEYAKTYWAEQPE